MGIERVTHYIDNVLTEAQARMGLRNTRLLVTWYTNRENRQSVVHSHPYHELVLPIGGSTVRYSVDGSVYLVHVNAGGQTDGRIHTDDIRRLPGIQLHLN